MSYVTQPILPPLTFNVFFLNNTLHSIFLEKYRYSGGKRFLKMIPVLKKKSFKILERNNLHWTLPTSQIILKEFQYTSCTFYLWTRWEEHHWVIHSRLCSDAFNSFKKAQFCENPIETIPKILHFRKIPIIQCHGQTDKPCC